MLHKLIEYDSWANRKVAEALEGLRMDEVTEMENMLAHLLAAQIVWHNRALNIEGDIEVWPELTDNEIRKMLENNPAKLKKLVDQKDEIISYRNSKGKEFQNSVEEILHHIVIHGQHHRAQIAKLMRQAGHTPPATDFIFYLRGE